MSELAISTIVEKQDLPQLFGKKDGDKAAIEKIVEQVENEAKSVVFDIKTKAGQATCRSLAAKIASAKTTLDKLGKSKKEEYTVITKQIDADRKLARERLQKLQDEIRKPLTEFEEREKARKAQHETNLEELTDVVFFITEQSSSDSIKKLITKLENKAIGDEWEEYKPQALEAKDNTLRLLRKELEIVSKREAEQAELERLRQEDIKRKQAERDAEIARQAEERAKAEAEAKAKAEKERAEREIKEAKEREARLIAEKEAAELRAKQEAEQAVIAERKRIEDEKAEQARLEAKRKADKAHRDSILIKAKDDFVDAGIDEDTAKEVVKLIYKNKISNISIQF